MSENTETLEAPNWLSELEKKREHRLKARLGHEAGAGAPCIKCNEKCPGLDLHFWRKICKNCKCSKEDHDVHDDDIYGWAQFQLLGSKPNKIKKKIVLPGKKDEVELDWTPKGNTETIDRYLKTVAPETLPVKGSQAAQERKQLLQKQIPIHDIDPTLCHDLTDSELAKMQDYIKHMKNSAGVGQIIQFNINYGNKHNLGDGGNIKMISDRYPKGIPSIETVQLLGEQKTGNLTKQLDKLTVQDQKELDAFFDKIPKPLNMTAHGEKLGYVPNYAEINQNVANPASRFAREHILNQSHIHNVASNHNQDYRVEPIYANQIPGVGNIPTNQSQSYGGESVLPNQIPADLRANYINDVNRNLPHYAPGTLNIQSEQQNPVNVGNIHNYNPKILLSEQQNPASIGSILNYNPNTLDIQSEQQNPVSIGNMHNYNPKTLNIQSEQQNPVSVGNMHNYNPNTLNIQNEQQNPIGVGNIQNYNTKTLPGYNPNQFKIPESQLTPNKINIGSIRDINYDHDNPEIKKAIQSENKLFEAMEPGRTTIPDDGSIQTKQCRKCSKFFEPGEFAIFIEKSDALYHSNCFKCAGCNQNLADLFYFYDKETDDVYCGRDFAKIRGIPRCKACDELIFVKEYCLAENSTFHLKHFCCFECDTPLAGQNYVVEDSQPVCLPCYEKVKASKCTCCGLVIKPDEQGVALAENIHFHAENCFACSVCKKSLHGAKLLFKNRKLYCSHECFRSDQ